MVARIAARICMMVLFVTALTAGPTLAQTDDANKILKAMSDYLGSQKDLLSFVRYRHRGDHAPD